MTITFIIIIFIIIIIIVILTVMKHLPSTVGGSEQANTSEWCSQPCTTTYYEPTLSSATISSISVSQILGQDTKELQEKYKIGLNTEDKVNEKKYVSDLRILRNVTTNFESLRQYLKKTIESNDTGLRQVNQAIRNFGHLLRTDRTRRLFRHIDGMIAAFEDTFGADREVLYYNVRKLGDDIGRVTQYKDAARMKPLLDNVIELIGMTHTSLQGYHVKLRNVSNMRKLNDKLPLQTNGSPLLIAQCDRNVSASLMFLTNTDLAFRQFITDVGMINSSAISLIREEYHPFKHLVTSTLVCLDEFYTTLKDASNLLKSAAVTAYDDIIDLGNKYDVIDEFAPLIQHQRLAEEVLQMYSKGAITKLDMSTFISDVITENAVTSFRAFDSELRNTKIYPLREQIRRVERGIPETYKLLLNLSVQLQKYLDNKYYFTRARNMEIWKRPLPKTSPESVDDLYSTSSNVDLIWSKTTSLEEFVQTKAKYFLDEHAQAFFEEANSILDGTEKKVKEYERILVTSLRDFASILNTFKKRNELDEAFVR